MIDLRCPGSGGFREPEPEIFRCPKCGSDVEIWTDELKGLCEKCGEAVFKEAMPSCLEWCRFAKECVGEEKYKKFLEIKKQAELKSKKGK